MLTKLANPHQAPQPGAEQAVMGILADLSKRENQVVYE